LIVCFAIWLAMHASMVTWTPMRLTGAALATVSFILLTLARIQLGRSFSITAQARRLVTTGLYPRIRNPIYVFSALYLCGLAVAAAQPKLLLLLLVLVPVQAVRARREEHVLSQAFGDEYARY
jgi:protein-S-isoprenylcysteine O-methyltransferase Ste14